MKSTEPHQSKERMKQVWKSAPSYFPLCLIFGCGIFLGIVPGMTGSTNKEDDGVRITRLTIPHSIENGTKTHTILDCEYSLKDNLTDYLEVTWLYNDREIVYKWIPGHDLRQPRGILQSRLDPDYEASQIPWEKYRALKILKPTTELSGKFTCDISTLHGHKAEGSILTVFSKPKEFELKIFPRVLNESHVNVSCWASGAYPEPKISISYVADENQITLTDGVEETSWTGSTYDVSTHSVIDLTKLSKPSTMISCDIKIPNTSYFYRKELALPLQDDVDDGEDYDSGASILNFKLSTTFALAILISWFNILSI